MSDKYKDLEKQKHDSLANAQKSKHKASDSTIYVEKEVPSTFYFIFSSDDHLDEAANYSEKIKLWSDYAKVPNLYMGFGGDQIDMGLKDSITGPYGLANNPEEAVSMFADAFNASGFKKDNLLFLLDGNHENRLEKKTSFKAGKQLAKDIGLKDKYAQNIAKVMFYVDNPVKPGEKIPISFFNRHGENLPANPGANADKNLARASKEGADVINTGHTHRPYSASNTTLINEPHRKTPRIKKIQAFNWGANLEPVPYSDQAGYDYPKKSNGDILRVKVVPNEAGNDYDICFDFMNIKEILNNRIKEKLSAIDDLLKKIEDKEFTNITPLKKSYSSLINNKLSKIVKNYTTEKENDSKENNNKKISNSVYAAFLNGLEIGNEAIKNEKEIDKAIKTLSLLNDSTVVTLTNVVHYKKANLLKGEKYVEETFAAMQSAAETLKPIKDKIRAYNSGMNEVKIMKYQAKELAEFATTRLQLDEKFVYMPSNKKKLEELKKIYQNQEVEKYNKSILKKEIGKYLKKTNNDIEELYDYGLNAENTDEENFEMAIVKKLRSENKLLSMTKDKVFIDHKFKLSIKDLKEPHPNLVQNIILKMMDVDPKNVTINPNYESESHFNFKIKDDKNKTRNIGFVGTSSKSIGGRSALKINTEKIQHRRSGQDVYFTNAIAGKEFVSPITGPMVSKGGKTVIKDGYHISAGTFNNVSERIDQQPSSNKIYKFKAYNIEPKSDNDIKKGIHNNSEKEYHLTCSSIDYETALLDEDIFIDAVKQIVNDSQDKKIDEVYDLKSKKMKEKAKKDMYDKIELIETRTNKSIEKSID